MSFIDTSEMDYQEKRIYRLELDVAHLNDEKNKLAEERDEITKTALQLQKQLEYEKERKVEILQDLRETQKRCHFLSGEMMRLKGLDV